MKLSTQGVELTDEETKRLVNRIKEFIKNKPIKAIILTSLFMLAVCGIIGYLLFVNPLQKEKEQISQNYQTLLANLLQTTQQDQSPSPTQCVSGKFPTNKDDWVISQYDNPDQEGFYCTRLRSDFLSPSIWYKNSISTKFESIEFKYEVKNRNKDTDTFPPFIVSFGKDPTIFRLYLPLESNSQLVGFEKIIIEDSNYSLERETPKKLKKPVKEEVENEIKIRMVIEQDNKVTFFFNPIYISSISEEEPISIEDSISYSFLLPHDPKPGSALSESEIGFGTLKGSCVKPISYRFCY